jgi:FkbM family methyltransferase
MSADPSTRIGALERVGLRAAAAALGWLPHSVGQFRLASSYIAHRAYAPGQVRTQRLANGPRLSLDLGDRAQAIAYLTRRYAPELPAYILSGLPSGATVFDVGANVGLVTFQVAGARPDITVHAFEPHPGNVVAWRRNQEVSRTPNARLEPAAVSHTAGKLRLVLQADSAGGYVGDGDDGVSVPAVTLDDYCDQHVIDYVDALKIDVEGAELSVLRGAGRLLAERRVRRIVCEVNTAALRRSGSSSAALFAMLEDHGYVPQPIPDIGLRRYVKHEANPSDSAFELSSR